jgi:hypothetical protein
MDITVQEQIDNLERCVQEFRKCIESLPESLFLKKMDSWAPRDVAAHLIGWNLATIKGCRQIMKGETPFYLIDPGDDFCKFNAVLAREYGSRDKKELIAQLDASTEKLREFLMALGPIDYEADFGVKYQGKPVTIRKTIDALMADFTAHRKQIDQWVNKMKGVPNKGSLRGFAPQ